jgi:hypothetical protein
VLDSDASGYAFGAVLSIGGVIVEDTTWMRSKRCNMHINIAEMEAAVRSLVLVERAKRSLEINDARPTQILMRLDNLAVVSWLLKEAPQVVCESKKMVINRLQKFKAKAQALNIEVSVVLQKSEENISDALSRVPDFLKAAYKTAMSEETSRIAERAPRAAQRIAPLSLGESTERPDTAAGQLIVKMLEAAGGAGVKLGSLTDALQSLVDDGKISVEEEEVGAVALDYGGQERGGDGKSIFRTEEEVLKLLQFLHAQDHPGRNELLLRASAIISRESLTNLHFVRTTASALTASCLFCKQAKPHFDQSKLQQGKRAVGASGRSAIETPSRVNRILYPVGRFPWEQVHLDIMGPWNGTTFFIVLIDSYSKFAMVHTMAGMPNGRSCMKILKEVQLNYYTTPRRVVVDQGRQFILGEFKELVTEMGAELQHTGTEAHWQNGVVERFIGDFKNRLTACMMARSARTDHSAGDIAYLAQRVVKAHNQWPRSSGKELSPASQIFRCPTWVDEEIICYRPNVEPGLYSFDPEESKVDRDEIANGPKVGEVWKVRVTGLHRNGGPRHVPAKVVEIERRGIVVVKNPKWASSKRLVMDQLLELITPAPQGTPVGGSSSSHFYPPDIELPGIGTLSSPSQEDETIDQPTMDTLPEGTVVESGLEPLNFVKRWSEEPNSSEAMVRFAEREISDEQLPTERARSRVTHFSPDALAAPRYSLRKRNPSKQPPEDSAGSAQTHHKRPKRLGE